jgi:hypothetical protein
VLDYVLMIPREDAVECWTGPRRRSRVLATVHAGELIKHHPMLLDRQGRVCVDLWPLAQVVSPTERAEPELFVFEGRGRHGAQMVAAHDGYEHFDRAGQPSARARNSLAGTLLSASGLRDRLPPPPR